MNRYELFILIWAILGFLALACALRTNHIFRARGIDPGFDMICGIGTVLFGALTLFVFGYFWIEQETELHRRRKEGTKSHSEAKVKLSEL